MSFIAGRYTATYNALALGQSADGFRLSHQFFKQLIRGDAYAQTPQDAVYQGGEMDLAMRMIEYNAAAIQTIMWPYSATIFDLGTIGRTDVGSAVALQIILTAVAGTPAAAAPATLTIPKTILKEGFPVELLFFPGLREVPLRQRCYPSTTGVFATQT